MILGHPIVLVVLAAGLLAGLWFVRRSFSRAARQERRRRRSNSRVASTARRPMVKFSVRTRKK